MVTGLTPDQLPQAPIPQTQGGVTVTGPGLAAGTTFQRVIGHAPVAVYREGATITPAHSSQVLPLSICF